MEIQHLHKIRNGMRWIFVQEHMANRYRSRLWFILPVLFNLPGGIIAFLAIRHDDLDKAKNCILVGILLIIPLAISLTVAVAAGEAIIDDVIAGELIVD